MISFKKKIFAGNLYDWLFGWFVLFDTTTRFSVWQNEYIDADFGSFHSRDVSHVLRVRQGERVRDGLCCPVFGHGHESRGNLGMP